MTGHSRNSHREASRCDKVELTMKTEAPSGEGKTEIQKIKKSRHLAFLLLLLLCLTPMAAWMAFLAWAAGRLLTVW
jgi:hypothetical protein